MRRIKPGVLALEQNTMIDNPASPLCNVSMPASGAAVAVQGVKVNLLQQLEIEPFKVVDPDDAQAMRRINDQYIDREGLQQDEEQIDSECLAVEEAAAVAHTLQQMAQVATEGLDATAAKLMTLASEHLLESVGFSRTSVALEDGELATLDTFAEPKKKEETGKSFAGKLGEKIQRIWQAILAALQRARLWLKNQFRRMFDISDSILRDCTETKHRAFKIKEKTENFRRVMLSPLVLASLKHNLNVDGKWPAEAGILDNAALTTQLILRQMARFKSDSLFNGSFVAQISAENIDAASYDPKQQMEHSKLREVEHGLAESPALLGGYVIEQRLHPATQGPQALKCLTDTPYLHRKWSTIDIATESIAIMNLRGAVSMVEAAEAMAKTVKDFRDIQTKLDHMVEELVGAVKARLGQASSASGDTVDNPAVTQAQEHFMTAAPRIFVAEPAKLTRYALNTAHWMLAYAKACLQIHQ